MFLEFTSSCPSCKYTIITNDRVKYREGNKNSYQLVLDNHPFTRHGVHGTKIYWRCVQFRPLKCRARLRTDLDGHNVTILRMEHNHEVLSFRRKKGEIKRLKEFQTKNETIKWQMKNQEETSWQETTEQYETENSYTFVPEVENSSINFGTISPFTYNYRGHLVYKQYAYAMHSRNGKTCIVQWRCSERHKKKCRATLVTKGKSLLYLRDRKPSLRLLNSALQIKPLIKSDEFFFNLKCLNHVPSKRIQQQKRFQIDLKNITPTILSKLPPNPNAAPKTKYLYAEGKYELPDGAILKEAFNKHKLIIINKPRLFGRCVNCLKNSQGRNILNAPKIITHCPKCPGGPWMCEACFDDIHVKL